MPEKLDRDGIAEASGANITKGEDETSPYDDVVRARELAETLSVLCNRETTISTLIQIRSIIRDLDDVLKAGARPTPKVVDALFETVDRLAVHRFSTVSAAFGLSSIGIEVLRSTTALLRDFAADNPNVIPETRHESIRKLLEHFDLELRQNAIRIVATLTQSAQDRMYILSDLTKLATAALEVLVETDLPELAPLETERRSEECAAVRAAAYILAVASDLDPNTFASCPLSR